MLDFLSLLFFACNSLPKDTHDTMVRAQETHSNTRRSIDVCAVLEEPSAQHSLIFLYKTDQQGVEAQVELITIRENLLFRCQKLSLAIPYGHDEIQVDMDWMPRGAPVAIDEMRIFARAPHHKDDTYTVARYAPAPFQDYFFYVNLTTPALYAPSTIYLPPQ